MTRVLPFSLLLSLLSFACGDDDDGRTYRSGVVDDAPISTLDDDKRAQICRSLDAHVSVTLGFDEVARLLCLPEAILLGGSREGCQMRLDECVKSAPEPVRVRAAASREQVCFENLAQCEASVSNFEGCVNVSVGAALTLLERATCAGVDDPETRRAASAMRTAGACAELRAECDDGFGLFL